VRFWRFNAVGVLGFVVQLATLALLVRGGMHYLAATALAVEAAVLHNFLWHERWTWHDRPSNGWARLVRLGRFHLLNGIVSLAGNVLIMHVLVGICALPALPSNAVAVVLCAAVNFLAADALVFST
jgi:putative flippase GtrA